MKTLRNLFLVLIILTAVILSGCDGGMEIGGVVNETPVAPVPQNSTVVLPLGLMATLDGLRSVVAGKAGTLIIENEKLVLMAWPVGENYGFAIIGKDGKPIYETLKAMGWTSQISTPSSVANLISFALDKGWKFISPAQLPVTVVTGLMNATIASATNILPNVLVLPAGNLTPFMPDTPVKD